MIKVSVVIPSYNVRPYIRQCLESVTRQNLREIEIFCIDSGSTDGTVAEIERYAAEDKRIRLVHSDIKSYGYQVNIGLALAQGEYVAIVESDDYVAENMYEVLFDIGSTTGAEIIKADYQRVIAVGEAERKVYVPLLRGSEYYNKDIKLNELDDSVKEMIFDSDYNIWSGIYRTDFLRRNKILCNETSGAAFQDIGFVLQSLSAAQSLYYLNKPMYQYRYMRDGSSTLRPEVMKFVYQEISFLLEKETVKKSKHFPMVMKRLSNIFLHEFGRMSSKYDFHEALEKDYLKIRPYFESYRTDEWAFSMLMAHPVTYAVFMSRIIKCREKWETNLAERLKDQDIVIVCYGQRGKYLEMVCKERGVKLKACCDNGHIPGVLSVEDCCKAYPYAHYMISSKFYGLSLQQQLLDLGVAYEQIEIFRPADNLIFYGAGKIGKRCGLFFSKHNAEPICYLDREADRAKKCIGGVPVLSAVEFLELEGKNFAMGASILITMAQGGDAVKENLLAKGINPANIYRYENRLEFLDFFIPKFVALPNSTKDTTGKVWDNIYFDLGNGVVLGGVESWSVDMGNYLKKTGKNIKYVSWCYDTDIYNMTADEVIGLTDVEEFYAFEHCLMVTKSLLRESKFVYVCNFCNMILDLVIWLKSYCHLKIKIIAVVHNDMEGYYETYAKYLDHIDVILYMSIKQKKVLIEKYNIPENKLKFLGWHIPCEEELKRRWSKDREILKIGYAGRLVLSQKRADLLLRLMVILLLEEDMDICFTIAGDGTYRENMEKELGRLGLLDRVIFLGQLPKTEMLSFWHEQDVMVSCSDWEGNSISKAEAMAAGAVPVVTDTSGASDDIEHGRNGYIVPVGDVCSMAEHISNLYQHRELLPKLGNAAHEKILLNNKNFSVEKLWEEIF